MTIGLDTYKREQFISKMSSLREAQEAELDDYYERWRAGEVDHPSLGSYATYADSQRAQRKAVQFSDDTKPDLIPGREKARLKKLLKSLTKEELEALKEEEKPEPEQNTVQSEPDQHPEDDPSDPANIPMDSEVEQN